MEKICYCATPARKRLKINRKRAIGEKFDRKIGKTGTICARHLGDRRRGERNEGSTDEKGMGHIGQRAVRKKALHFSSNNGERGEATVSREAKK